MSKSHSLSKFDKKVVSYAESIIKYRLLVILMTFALVAIVAYGMSRLTFDTDYRVFFSDDNPQLVAFDELQNVYTKTDNIVFVLKPKDGNIFSPDILKAAQDITEESWKLPYSKRVDSITNFQHTYAEGDDLTVIDLVEGNPYELSQEDFDYIKSVASNEPILVGNIVAKDLKTTGVNVVFNIPDGSTTIVPIISEAANKLIAKYQESYPDIEMAVSGLVPLNNAFAMASQKDMMTLIPIMYVVLIVTMFLFIRSISATIVTVFVIIFSALIAMGSAGWSGIGITPPSSSAPTIILTLAIADSIHIIVSMIKAMHKGMDKRQAIVESIRINIQPVFLTSITTAIGFMTLNFSDSPPFHDLGNITAVGVMAAFFFSMLFLPAALSLMPFSKKHTETRDNDSDLMAKLGRFVVRNNKKLLISMSALVILLAAAIPRIYIDDQWLKYFDNSIPFKKDAQFMIDNLSGIYLMEYSVGSTGAGGVNDPTYLHKLDQFSDWLREQPEVSHVYSVTDIFKRLNKNMHGDDQNWYRIPDSKEMAAQYLLLYEFSLPYGLDLTDRINIDKSASRITVTLKGDTSTSTIREFKDKSEKWLVENAPEYMNTEATSPSVMFAYIADRNINSMLKGNTIALFVISLIIIFALKNVKIGSISLIPNLIPPIMGFGIWALTIQEVNMAVALVTSICLGIIVDDTVHFLSKYNRAIKEKGLDAKEAVKYSFSTVGSALTVTSFVLIAGFSVLVLSTFKMNSLMGLLTAIIIACALVADFLLLPPILMLLDRNKTKKKGTHNV